MADGEEYFPRGGKKPTTTYFKQSENFLGAAEKREKKKRKSKKKSEDDDGYLSDEVHAETDQSYKNCGIWLNYKVVKEGLLLLGRVSQVLETKVNVALPCRMNGVVMACHISEAYNKILEAYVNDQTDAVRELPQMFQPGQYIAVKVLEVTPNNLMLTMMPQHINSGRNIGDLYKGALLQAAVSSVEDHGYVMDIGIPNTRAFLPKDSSNSEIELDTGMLTWVTVKSTSAENSVVTLSGELPALQRAVQRSKTNTVIPGTALEFVIDKPLDNGIEGHIFDKTTSYIQRNQVDMVKGKKPILGQKIRARLLYMVPPNKMPFFTMKSIFETTYPDLVQEQKFKDGDIIDDAKVLKITGRSVHLKLGEGSTGILSLRRVAIHEDLTDEQVLAKSYPVGSSHKVRVLCYNLADYVYSVSDSPQVLAETPFRLDELNVGELLTASVTLVADEHLRVTVGRVYGYVPHAHMTDTGIFVDPKKASISKLPKKKFKVGQEVQARVLTIDLVKQHLVLTLKPSLLDPGLELLTSYEEAVVGRVYTGVVAHIKDYLLVSFFNNILAYVPRKLVSAQPLDNLNDAFHVGQIVKCTIMSVNPGTRKMSGSLTTGAFKPTEKQIKATKRKNNDQETRPKKQKSDKNESKKRKNSENETTDVPEVNEESRKKKKKRDKNTTEEAANPEIQPTELTDTKQKKKKKRDKEDATIINESAVENNKNKKKNKNIIEETAETQSVEVTDKNKSKHEKYININQDTELENTDKKRKKKNKEKEHKEEQEPIEDVNNISEESDAIETDIQEDSDQVLTPQDLSLIDLSDCVTPKNYKKRVVSLLKSINARTKRLDRIEKKIAQVEARGLHAKNKKYHTAMNMEKLVIAERMTKLMEALKIVQDKLKGFDSKENVDSKMKSESVSTQDKITDSKKPKDIKEKEVDDQLDIIKVVEDLNPVLEVPSAKDFWLMSEETLTEKKEEELSSSDEEEQEKPKKKRKKLTVAEKAAKAREEEEKIRELERRAIESEHAPRSSDQFERAVLSEPNCSQLWIAYMAFHLQATEIDKARAVGRKALSTINFREEAEKLNVWLALLNIEHRFGIKESQQKTLEDALQMNDTYQIHTKLLDILLDTSKHQELVALVELMMRKYRRQPQVYQVCGEACYKAGLVDKARHVMQKGIAALEKKDHVSLLVYFAQLERSLGSRERCEALFEQVLAVYPQRVDVCAAYLDALRAAGDVDKIRQVMERMTSQNLPARKMKVLFKKWIEVEEKIGDEQHVESVRQRALEYINKAKF